MIPANVPQATSAAPVSLCILRVGSETFGLEISGVEQVLAESNVQPVPLAPDFVSGIMPYRGDVLLVLCLRRILSLPDRPQNAAAGIAILRDPCTHERFGLAADEINTVQTMDPASLRPNPCTLDLHRAALFAGVYQTSGEPIIRLDTSTLAPTHLLAASSTLTRRSL